MIRALAIALALSSLSGCCWFWRPSGPETLVVLVPSRHDGHVGTVVVSKGDDHEVLNTAYAAVSVQERGHVHRESVRAEDIDALFGQASAALPRRAVSFSLYFETAKDELTADSKTKLEQVLSTAAGWEAAEITVTGHTDLMGSDEKNDALSLARAQRVRQMLIDRGAKPEMVNAVGVGKREPAVQTAEGVAEAANRRVEVQIR